MKYFPLVWAALMRSKTRTLLTLLSVMTAFLLFGMLDSVRVAFNSGGSVAGANRMITTSRLSITQMLPYRLDAQIRAVPGVKKAAFAAWFGGIYRDPQELLCQLQRQPGLSGSVSRVQAAGRAEEGLAGRPARRYRRRSVGQAVRLESGRHHPAAGHHLPHPRQQ